MVSFSSSDTLQSSDKRDDLPLPLPTLSSTPVQHPDCCLGLSTALLDTILHIFHAYSQPANPRESTKDRVRCLSIGSGTGLFEATLITSSARNRHSFDLDLLGLEVASSTTANKYLPHELRCTVPSTSSLYDEASEFDVWIFVYPRDPNLAKKYLDLAACERSKNPRLVLFLGPKADFLPGHETQDEPQQQTFPDVLGSVSDHLDVCRNLMDQEDDAGPQDLDLSSRCSGACTCKSNNNKSRPFHATILSSPTIGITSYETLCVLYRCSRVK
ncbi:uncharacterized protein PV06_00077 [Exophiala oligosperma]|uniref:Uncharacterized protein n=1 Tax=Exophiala oligosperma TaxID=215243 RepID=A0A0D2CBS0_9EURO|nr:uncharacterized protein PV06_00077 [Exophiala oligosperma]KIW47377.1 hypothetical protein PV06_00077 [Exophiala oligosperma]